MRRPSHGRTVPYQRKACFVLLCMVVVVLRSAGEHASPPSVARSCRQGQNPARQHRLPFGAPLTGPRERLLPVNIWMASLPMEIVKAASAGDVKAVVSWIEAGGKVDTRYSKPDGSAAGGSLLITASDAGDAKMVDVLLERRATLDLQDSFGNSALMHAAGGGHIYVVRRLLRAGAQPGLRGTDGCTALQWAEGQGHAACVQAIKDHIKQAAARQGEALSARPKVSSLAAPEAADVAAVDPAYIPPPTRYAGPNGSVFGRMEERLMAVMRTIATKQEEQASAMHSLRGDISAMQCAIGNLDAKLQEQLPPPPLTSRPQLSIDTAISSSPVSFIPSRASSRDGTPQHERPVSPPSAPASAGASPDTPNPRRMSRANTTRVSIGSSSSSSLYLDENGGSSPSDKDNHPDGRSDWELVEADPDVSRMLTDARSKINDFAEKWQKKQPQVADLEAEGTFYVQLLRATKLIACDDNGLSDPYCKLSLGDQQQRSRTIRAAS